MKFVNCTSHAAISINLSKVNPIQPEGRAGGGGGGVSEPISTFENFLDI